MILFFLVVFLPFGVSSEGFEAKWTFLENNNLKTNNNHLISLVQNEFIQTFNCTNLNHVLTDLSAACQLDLLAVFSTILQCNHTEMAQDFKEKVVETMLDASGKKPAGSKQGGLIYWGDNLECRAIEYAVPYKNETLQGGYSRIFYNAKLKDASDPKNCDILKSTLIGWDLCSPQTCANQDDLMKLLKKFPLIDANGSVLTHSPICYVTTLDSSAVEPTYQTWIVVILMSVVIIMAFVATFIDYYGNLDVNHGFKASRLYKLFLCFSLCRNLPLIFHVDQTTKQDQIMSFNFLRFLSISWVVMGHIIAAYIDPHLLNNYLQLFTIVHYIQSQIIWNAMLAVDTFFFMSGVLLAFLWFKNLNRNPKILASKKAWILFYVHRIIRISPPYFFALSFYIWVLPSLQWNMPLFMNSIIQPNPCLKYWWANFLYINNLVYIRDQCYVASWYLAADMQMFIFTPIILIPLAINPIYGILTSATLLAVSTLANMVTVYINHYGSTTYVTGWRDPEMKHADEYPRLMYQAAWIRCQIYIMGILVGYLLQRLKHLKINKTLNVVMWILASCLMLSALSGHYNQMNGQEEPLFWRAMYSGLKRPIWGLGLSWIIVSCYYGYGGLINKLISLKIWIPLSRLSFSVYLIHMIVLNFTLGLSQYPIVYSGFVHTFVTMVIPILVISFFLAVLWSALFEIPFFKMEATLIRSQMPKDESEERAIITHESE